MRILMIAPHPFYRPRGTPIAVRLLIEKLAGMGHKIDLVTYHLGEDIAIANVTYHRIRRPFLVDDVPIGPSWQKMICDIYLLFAVIRLVYHGHYDLIHAVEEGAFIADWLGRLIGSPYVYDMDSIMSEQIREKSRFYNPIAAIFAWFERHAFRRAVAVFAVCPSLSAYAERYHRGGRVWLLPDIPLTSVETDSSALPGVLVDRDHIRLVYVGNLEHYQGIDLMLDAFRIASEVAKAASLIIVGGSSEEIAGYRARIAGSGIQDRIHFVGSLPVSQLSQVLDNADILLSPRIKGLNTPMKIYSYLQSGKPIIATRLSTHTQVLDDETALLVEPVAESMAAGMIELIQSSTRRKQLGDRGRQLAENEYSEAVYTDRVNRYYGVLEQYLSVCGRRAS